MIKIFHTKPKGKTNFVFLTLFFYFLFSGIVLAASPFLYFSSPTGDIAPGSEFPVRVLIDSDEPLNAYSVSFSYPVDELQVVGFNKSRSIIDVWQGQPTAKGGRVEFRGGSLSSFRGEGGELLTVSFKALKEGMAELNFTNPAFYLADGKGTKVTPTIKEGAAPLTQAPSSGADKTSPEIRFLSLVQDPFNLKQKLLSFDVRDTNSGVKETATRHRSYFSWSDWEPVQNPGGPVPASAWTVDFRATDNAGNVLERRLYDWPALVRSIAEILFAIIVAAVAAIGFTSLFRR